MPIFNRASITKQKPSLTQSSKYLDQAVERMATRQVQQSQSGAPITASLTNNANRNVESNAAMATQSDADRVNAIRQGRGQQIPVNPNPPTGPRVGATPFNANTNQVQSDADRVNAIRQGRGGSPPVDPNPPKPRVGSTPFNANTNQSDLNPNFDLSGGQPPRSQPDTRSTADKILDEQIARLVANGQADEAQRTKARADAAKTFDVQNAFAIESARARSGAFGAGTLGAGQALEAQTAREGARAKNIGLEEIDRAARDEAIKSAMGIADIIGSKENIGISRDKLGIDREKLDIDRERLATDRELSKEEIAIKKAAAEREAAAFDMTVDEFEREMNQDRDGDGLIAGKSKEEIKNLDAQESIDAANADPNNPLSADNMMAFAKDTNGGNVQQIKAWTDSQGKPLTLAMLGQLKGKYQEYLSRGGKAKFNEWFSSEVDSYWGGWNPASNLRGII